MSSHAVCLAYAATFLAADPGPTVGLSVSEMGDSRCELSTENARFVQTALDGWERASRRHLKLDPHPLPWIILIGSECTWHLAADPAELTPTEWSPVRITFAGTPIRVGAEPHDGSVQLPNGARVPVQPLAFASLYRSDTRPFLVVALLDVWRTHPRLRHDPKLEATVQAIVSHEIVHTRQLVAVAGRVAELRQRYELPQDIGDDIVEGRFGSDEDFVEAHESETDLFYQAAGASDEDRRLALLEQALQTARERRNRYLVGADAAYRHLEGLFLNMEGVAVWVAYRLAHPERGSFVDYETLNAERARNTWTQDEGLPLFLLLDALVRDWREKTLGEDLASPFTLLEEAVAARRAGNSPGSAGTAGSYGKQLEVVRVK